MFYTSKILSNLVRHLLAIFLPISLSSCILEGLPECDYGNELISVTLNLEIEPSMVDYKHISYPDFSTRSDSSEWPIKYWVAAYKDSKAAPIIYQALNSPSTSFNLVSGNYSIIAWAEPVPNLNESPYYFHTDDFTEMLQKHKYAYKGNDLQKTPYRGVLGTKISVENNHLTINLKPAFARYRLLANDTDSLLFTPGKIKISYYDLPGAINGITGEISLKWNDISYESRLENELLAFDHVLSHNTNETTVSLKVEIYDDEDKRRAMVDNITIPLINGGTTTLEGNFFSMLVNDDEEKDPDAGGVIIDREWENTYYIEY